ncbi:hypothetical protein ABT336_11600 [Micromonospora sp. NPDC000207]|uniref:hypothetical protein n=1 Tax=Micromonospora sp. NPDC000207 TaxID=3154246 RepID=UPI0033191C52
MTIRAGDEFLVGREASVQFGTRPIRFRVIRVRDDLKTYHGWLWLDGYALDKRGEAVERRTIFVRPVGLRALPTPQPPTARRPRPIPRNTRR